LIVDGGTEGCLEAVEELVQSFSRVAHEGDEHGVLIAGHGGVL
jgi:hypothetical protein